MDGSSSSPFSSPFGLVDTEETSSASHEGFPFSGLDVDEADKVKSGSPKVKVDEAEDSADAGGSGEPKAEAENYAGYLNADTETTLKSGDLKECFKNQKEAMEATIQEWNQTFEELEQFEEQVAEELETALKHAEFLNVYTNKQKDECKQRLQALSKALSLF